MAQREATKFLDIAHDGLERDPLRPKMAFSTNQRQMMPLSMEGLVTEGKNDKRCTVAICTGSDAAGLVNYGTLIFEEVHRWLKSVVGDDAKTCK
mmetsp:Transcript_73522/g.142213  ORF Transcript_73522/g.142213 Transcript_73522/m.142213 type:complete len:94 (-) Transcript_73522:76-357(-)